MKKITATIRIDDYLPDRYPGETVEVWTSFPRSLAKDLDNLNTEDAIDAFIEKNQIVCSSSFTREDGSALPFEEFPWEVRSAIVRGFMYEREAIWRGVLSATDKKREPVKAEAEKG